LFVCLRFCRYFIPHGRLALAKSRVRGLALLIFFIEKNKSHFKTVGFGLWHSSQCNFSTTSLATPSRPWEVISSHKLTFQNNAFLSYSQPRFQSSPLRDRCTERLWKRERRISFVLASFLEKAWSGLSRFIGRQNNAGKKKRNQLSELFKDAQFDRNLRGTWCK